MEVITYHLGGNSFPIVVQEDNKKFLVKLRAGLSGEYSLLSEWLGNHIGRFLGLNTRQPHWVILTDALKYDAVYIEVRDLIDKSLGVNIGFEYIENAEVFDLNDPSEVGKGQQIDIYLLDLLMLNIDRTSQNHNLLVSGRGVLVTDFDSSLIFNELLNNASLSSNKQIFQCLKSHPFYQKIEKKDVKKFLEKVNRIDFEKIINGIPDELLSCKNKTLVLAKIDERKLRGWGLMELIENLENIELETESEKKLRTKKNRERLERIVESARYKGSSSGTRQTK